MKLDLSNSFDKNKAQTRFEKLVEKGARIELKEFRGSRNLSQNAYIHVCFTIVADEMGDTIYNTKQILKNQFGSFMLDVRPGLTLLRSTADLNKEEISQFIDWIRDFSENTLACYIPTSEEYIANRFEIDRQLQHVK